jgi:hypothetical protein
MHMPVVNRQTLSIIVFCGILILALPPPPAPHILACPYTSCPPFSSKDGQVAEDFGVCVLKALFSRYEGAIKAL